MKRAMGAGFLEKNRVDVLPQRDRKDRLGDSLASFCVHLPRRKKTLRAVSFARNVLRMVMRLDSICEITEHGQRVN